MGTPDVIAAIDVGTNSVHMVVARVSSNGRYEVVTREKSMVRLGEGALGVGSGGPVELTTAAMERGIDALVRCASIAFSLGAPVRAVATSAVREASNATEFIDEVHKRSGIEIEVISGNEEARLIYLGVLQALPVFDDNVVLIDVGGGSTEVLFGHRGNVDYARSIKVGAIRITNEFFPDGVVTPKALKKCRSHLRALFAPITHETGHLGRTAAVITSGTANTLARMVLAETTGEVPAQLNASAISGAELSRVVDLLGSNRDPSERVALPGMDPSRADVIVGGSVVLDELARALGLEELVVSELALREGVLLDTLSRMGLFGAEALSDLRRASVHHLMELCDDDPGHSIQVARLAMKLFDSLAERMDLETADRDILEAAALLSNVGLFIAHSAHHKHSYYVIRNTDHLLGFTDREVELIAQVARYHRRSTPQVKHVPYAALGEQDRRTVECLSALLRVAIGLDRSHDRRIKALTVEFGDPNNSGVPSVAICVAAKTGELPDVELFAARERLGPLETVLGTKVDIVDRTDW